MQRTSLPCSGGGFRALQAIKMLCKWPALCKANFWMVRQALDLEASCLGGSASPKSAGRVRGESEQLPTCSASRCPAVQLADAPC